MSKPREPRMMMVPIDPSLEPDWDVLDAITANLPDNDGEPLESPWHVAQIGLLIAMLYCRFRGRTDFFAGGNMFIYYDLKQALNRNYRGPDFFFVNDVDGTAPRTRWIVWQEHGRFPDVIVELLSPTTAVEDRTTKRQIYERIFRTPEYFLFDPDTDELEGFRLNAKRRYRAIKADERGWLWSEQLGLWLGRWEGTYLNVTGTWIRFYDTDGRLVPFGEEVEKQRANLEKHRADKEKRRADKEKQRADQEKQRADAAEVELARLKEQLAGQGGAAPESQG
jgi:Uma2 family endonuclease